MEMLTEPIGIQLEVLEDARDGARPFRFRGTALVQGGLSRNGRYYPAQVVAEAARRAGEAPLTVYARHRDALEGAGLPVGRVDRVYLNGPSLKYEATLAPTRLGRDLQALVEGGFVRGASIRAHPYASHRARLGEREVEYIDSMTLRGIDFTDDPGVPEAVGFEVLGEDAFDQEDSSGPLDGGSVGVWECGSVGDPSEGLAAPRSPGLGGQANQEEESMDLQTLDLESLRTGRPDLVRAICEEAEGILEEVRRSLGAADPAAVPGMVQELVRARTRGEIAEMVEAELRGEVGRQAIRSRLVEECATVAEARARLEKERAYALALRRAFLPGGVPGAGEPAGRGLADNAEEAALEPERLHARRLAGVA